MYNICLSNALESYVAENGKWFQIVQYKLNAPTSSLFTLI